MELAKIINGLKYWMDYRIWFVLYRFEWWVSVLRFWIISWQKYRIPGRTFTIYWFGSYEQLLSWHQSNLEVFESSNSSFNLLEGFLYLKYLLCNDIWYYFAKVFFCWFTRWQRAAVQIKRNFEAISHFYT